MFNTFGLVKLYHAAQYIFQTRISQTYPLSRSLCSCVEFNVSSSICSLKGSTPFNGPSSRLLHSQSRAVATQYRSNRNFVAETAAEEAPSPSEALPWQKGRAAARSKLKGDRESGDKHAERRASHSEASAAPKAARVPARSRNPILDDSMHPIRPHHIPRGVWTVLLRLRGAGHEGYLVGGAVRDLLLQGTPKDFDIVTTATPLQVKRLFGNCRIIGKRFPIVQVFADGSCLEVSSFGTRARRDLIPPDAAAFLPRHKGPDKAKSGKRAGGEATPPDAAAQPEVLWAAARVDNALARDFSCNSIMFDPFSALLLDYADGFRDCQRRVLRTVVDSEDSFREDPGRLLRAVRHAARVGLTIEDKTGQAMATLAAEALKLPGGRLLMEAQALFGYGAAAPSLRLLWRYRLLDVLVPPLAARFERKRLPRNPRRPASEPVLDLLEQLDKEVLPQYPIDWTVWAAVMLAPLVTDSLAAAQKAKRPKAGAKGNSGKRQRGKKEKLEAEKDDGACRVCKKTEAVLEQHVRFRDLVEDAVRGLILKSAPGAELKGVIPVAQWHKAASILVNLVDSAEVAVLGCEDCQAKSVVRDTQIKISRNKNSGLLSVLDNVLAVEVRRWVVIRQAL